jgi:hypothetical protein
MSSPAAGPADVSLTDAAGLAAALGCETAAEVDLVLYAAFELDPYVVETGPQHVVVAVRDRGVEVRFPCTLAEFWASVARLEAEARQRLEDESWKDS